MLPGSLIALLPLLRSRALSARELLDSCLTRIEAAEPDVQAFVVLTPELAQLAAVRADQDRAKGRPVGPLAGVPIALKDLYLTRGTPTEAGSRVLQGHDPGVDAAVWERFSAAGAGLIGKTTTHEFAYGTASAPTRNPWNRSRTPGGSSGGSAAALAAGMVPIAAGTDTGGSLRIPAAACGISTLRPAHGRVSTYGVLPLNPSLDVAGPMAARMRDVALLMRILAGYDERDAYSRAESVPEYSTGVPSDLTGVRIGLPVEMSWAGVDHQIAEVCRTALGFLVDRGAELVEITAPVSARHVLDPDWTVFDTINAYEAFQVHRPWLRHRDLYTPQVLARVLEGEQVSADRYRTARTLCREWAQDWRELLAEHRLDAVAHPTFDRPTPMIDLGEDPRGPRITLSVPWSLAGFPALSVPAGLDQRGLPVGLSLAGLPEQEAELLGLGIVIDEEVGLWRR
jgi:aspartyl-tRNA(Asn)/glutamyl-tRNA(Gln) amidotransferase subunit A